MEAKTEGRREQEFRTDRRDSPPLHHYPSVGKYRKPRRASQAEAGCPSHVSSRSRRKSLKTKDRCRVYPSQNEGGYFAVFGPFQARF